MSGYTSGGIAFDGEEPWAAAELVDVKHVSVWAGDELIAISSEGPGTDPMTVSWDSTGTFSVELHSEPRYPKARVDIGEFMEVDGMFHMMMQTCGELRRAGASEQEVTSYRERAINGNPWIETARWVTVGPSRRRTG